MQLPIISTKAAFAQFSETLQVQGLREALAYLLRLTDYRFIGIFRFEHGVIDPVAHYDRDHPAALEGRRTADPESYCARVRDGRQSFVTADAIADPRLRGHAAHESVVAYCGVPVSDAAGAVVGTLCHYDLVPREPAQIDLALMQDVAATLAGTGAMSPELQDAEPARKQRR